MTSLDLLICSVPGTFADQPTLAPALLKSCVKQAGFEVRVIDLNIEVYNKIKKYTNAESIKKFFFDQSITDDNQSIIGDLLDYSVDRILSFDPKILCLSLLTQDCQFFALWLCFHLKTRRPDIKIVIGGSGIKNYISESSVDFGKFLRTQGFIDDYINGDGEFSLVEYLRGNLQYPGINSGDWKPVVDLNQMPFSDFDDYDFTQYKPPSIPICDSRGCVRSCEFCDVIVHWKKYQYRTADNIFDEMLYQIKKYNIKYFFFYNALTNGNMKEFHKLLDLICEYNKQNPHSSISWNGYFIVRSRKQHPPEMWEKIKLSNGNLLLGIESVIEKVRISLGKNFLNEDIDYHLEMAQKYQVPLSLLLIVGYPTETKKDFEFTKKWFIDRKHYAKNPVTSVVFSLAAILPNTSLDQKSKNYGLVKGDIPTIWLSPETNVSTEDRLKYHNELQNIMDELGFSYSSGDNSLDTTQREIEI